MLTDKCNPDGSCSHTCAQGKDCLGSLLASRRAVMWLGEPEPIEEDDGDYLLDLAIALLVVTILACIFGGGTEWVVAALSK